MMAVLSTAKYHIGHVLTAVGLTSLCSTFTWPRYCLAVGPCVGLSKYGDILQVCLPRTREPGRLRLHKGSCSSDIYTGRQPLESSQPTTPALQTTNRDNNMPAPDYPVLLNNLLQEHRTGNLTTHFQYEMTREGPQDNVTHFATAIFRGVTYAIGRGKNKGGAKAAAAKVVYENFSENGVPEEA